MLLLTHAFGGALNTNGIKFIDYVVPGIIHHRAIEFSRDGWAQRHRA